jgi:hypothetical protein
MPSRRDLANAIRALSMDAVQQANSGHPGMPMGMADIAEVLWNDFLRHNPGDPRWPNRDRFVVSNGHGSMLLYSLLHLSGYPLAMDEIRNFRQFGSRTAGHPEYEPDVGIETTTGPLGQGIANAVGMAIAERVLGARFNRPGFRYRRSSHLGVHRRRLPDGGHLARGLLAGRDPRPGQAHRVLRRQRHLHRRRGRGVVHGRHAGALSRPTAGMSCRAWTATTPQAMKAAIEAARGRDRPPDADLLPHGHRLGVAEQVRAPRRPMARRWAPTKSSRTRANTRLVAHAPFEIPDEIRAGWDARERGARGPGGLGPACWPPMRQNIPRENARSCSDAWPVRCRRIGRQAADDVVAGHRGGRRQRRDPQGLGVVAERLRFAAAGTDRRLGRSQRFEQHLLQGQPASIGARRFRWQLPAFRRARVRHDGDPERASRCMAVSVPTAGPSSCSRTTRATRCAWQR